MTFGLILDLIIAAIVILCVFFSARRGFVRTLLELVGFIAAIVIAFTVSSPLADMTYDNIIGPSIVSTVEQTADGMSDNVSGKVWAALPGIIKRNSEKFGIEKETFDDKVKSFVSWEAGDRAEMISQNVTKPVIVKLVGAIYSLIIAILLIFVSKFLARVINKLFTFSIVGKLNTVLGGCIGVLKGAAVALVFCMVISILILISKDGLGIFTAENIESSHLFKLLYGFSPFV